MATLWRFLCSKQAQQIAHVILKIIAGELEKKRTLNR